MPKNNSKDPEHQPITHKTITHKPIEHKEVVHKPVVHEGFETMSLEDQLKAMRNMAGIHDDSNKKSK